MAAASDLEAAGLTELAPAKINLFLHVVGRRGDGYHLLESLVVFASIGDRLTVEPLDSEFEFRLSGRFANSIGGNPADNLVMRAAAALRKRCGSGPGARITLEKNLPVAAGIGGGSADAAAALLALNRLWNAGLTREDLAELALPLGADVPACLHRTAVMMRGIGEELSPVRIPPGVGVVLANPMKPLPTPAVFADFRSFEPFADTGGFDASAHRDRAAWFSHLRNTSNSLEPPARRLLPVVGTVVRALEQLEGCRLARMSGSGATCFALFDDWETAARRADQLAGARPDWWVTPGRLLT